MRIEARQLNEAAIPAEIAPWFNPDQLFVTPGTHYEVHAIAVYAGVTFVQFIDDLGYPSWKPGWLFDVKDARLPADWTSNLFQSELSLVIGPDFLLRDEDAYRRMVELDADQVRRFWARIDALGSGGEQP